MRLNITIENVESGDEELVIASIPVVRKWEESHGEPIGAKLEAGYVGPISELAHLAFNRKHGLVLTLDEFEDQYEPTKFDAGGQGANPSDPATDPLSD